MSDFDRDPSAGRWISRWPLSTFGAFLLAILATAGFCDYRLSVLTAEQRYSLPQYVKSSIGSRVPPVGSKRVPPAAVRTLNYGRYHFIGQPKGLYRHVDARDYFFTEIFRETLWDLFLVP